MAVPAPDAAEPDRERLLELLLEQGGLAPRPAAIPRRPDPASGRLSFSQQRLWFLDQLPNRHVYNVPVLFDVAGVPDPPLLERCLNDVVRRHEVLRTTFPAVGGAPAALVAPALGLRIPVFDLAAIPAAERLQEARLLIVEESRRPFDLAAGPLLRATLIRLSASASRLLVVMHHMVCDWWSIEVLARELATLYGWRRAGAEAALPELPVQFSDFAAWQREQLRGEALSGQLEYWRGRLRDAPALGLPTDRPRPPVQSYAGRRFHFEVPAPVAGALRRLCRRHRITLFAGVLAVFDLLLSRYTNQTDVLVGTPVSGRQRLELEPLIGFFLNTLVLRLDLGGDPTVEELLARAGATTTEALVNSDLPFEVLVDDLKPARDLSRSPFFQAWFSLFQVAADAGAEAPLRPSQEEIDFGISKFDLSLLMADSDERLAGVFEYSTDLFEDATVERMARHFLNLLGAVAEDPERRVSEIPMLSASERRHLLYELNATAADYGPPATLVKLLQAQAGRTPEATAVVCEGEAISYGELHSRADRLAAHLRALGAGPESIIGVCARRSVDMVVGLVAVLKAGAAYLPLDPDQPDDRLAYMCADSRCRLVLAQQSLLPRLLAGVPAVALDGPGSGSWRAAEPEPALAPSAPAPANAAYVMYTSGSTGRPKGVVIDHAGICNRLLWMQEAFPLTAADRVLQKTPFGFDVSVWELFWPLLTGATMVMARPGGHRDAAYLAGLIAEQAVTTAHFVPSMLRLFLEEPSIDRCRALRRVICSGEALPVALQARFQERLPAELHNLYGPTEASVDVTHHHCRELNGRGSIPIGRPIANVRLHIVGPDFEPQPVDVPGELLIGGVALARGYLGKPGLTAERFVPDPFGPPGERLYRSGDLARYLAGGEIEFLGRRDHQVKLHGNRIELGEVEAVLAAHGKVREAVVVLREDVPGDPRLVAYVVPRGAPPSVGELRRHLRAQLPAPMVPSAFVTLEALPLSTNGKLDRRALPPPAPGRAAAAEPYAAPRSQVERILAEAWAAVLQLDRVGIHDNFFALGGDSLKTVRVAGLARERGVELSVEQMFSHQTIAELAAHAGEAAEAGPLTLPEPFSLLPAGDRDRLPGDVEDAFPMTMLQAGMLLHMAFGAEVQAYHNVTTLKVAADFDSTAMQRAVDHVVARHPALRTSLHATGYAEPLALVHRRARLPVAFEDLRGLGAAEQEQAVTDYMEAEARLPMDVTRAPLLRLRVHRTEDGFWLTVTECHPVLDGWSFTSIVSELLECHSHLLAGQPLPEAAPSPPYQREFVRLEREAMASPEAEALWSRRLAGWRPQRLPRWPQRLRAPSEPSSHRLYVPIAGEVADGLERLARGNGVPLSCVLLAAHVRVLGLLTGERRVLSGVVLHGRPAAPDAEQARGLFLNVLPLGIELRGGTWNDLVRETFRAQGDLMAHRHYPQAAVQKAWARAWGREPMYEAAFNYTHFYAMGALGKLPKLELASTFREIARTNVPLMANFERSLQEDGVGVMMSLESEGGVISVDHLRRLAGTYSEVLAAMAREPSASYEPPCLLPPRDREELEAWSPVELAAAGARPAATRRWVLDSRLQPVLPGTPGELSLGGGEVDRARLGTARLTAARFVPDPLGPPGGRLFRTGERVRYLPDGSLEGTDGDAAAEPRPAATAPVARNGAGRAHEILARIWAEVLRLDRVGPEDDFFELGGDSIRALQITARLRDEGWRLSPEDIFDHPRIGELSPLLAPAAQPAAVGNRRVDAFALAALSPDDLAAVIADVGVEAPT